MVEVIVIAEGQTEEQFIKRLVAPAMRNLDIFVKAQILYTSRDARGGALNFDRLKFNVRNTLRQNTKAVVTTMLDLYGLDTSYPSYGQARPITDLRTRLLHLQAALHNAIVEETGCRPERFIPHIQPYEFEALLFSNPRVLVQIEAGWDKSLPKLIAVLQDFETPEHINDSMETKPSRRLEALLKPRYRKTLHGPQAAERITLQVMEQRCPHFQSWMIQLRALGNMR